MRTLMNWIEARFLVIALTLSALALWRPELFVWLAPRIPQGLGLIMFGMGLTLTFDDFRRVLGAWRLVLLGTALHYAIMPLAALAAARLLALSDPLTVGLAVVGACPSGTASSVAVYLARANVPLAVSVTLASTRAPPPEMSLMVNFPREGRDGGGAGSAPSSVGAGGRSQARQRVRAASSWGRISKVGMADEGGAMRRKARFWESTILSGMATASTAACFRARGTAAISEVKW